jgi:hypothetical protein
VTIEHVPDDHRHVTLFAGRSSDGQAVYEPVPATAVAPGVYDVLASPAMAYGCAAGDRIQVSEDGTFEVLNRGGNLCLIVLPATPPAAADIAALSTEFQGLGGIVESPPSRRFIVVTVPATAGFPVVEATVTSWTTDYGGEWEYGNVYDDDGRTLDWWTTK